MRNEAYIEIAIGAVMKAGKELLARRDDPLDVKVKESFRDIVSNADQAAEASAIDFIRQRSKDIPVLTEETGFIPGAHSSLCWIVDALDGTVNYVHGVPFFCSSVALVEDGRTIAAAIYAPLFDELYFAGEGDGAYKNERRLKVIDRAPEDSLFAASFSGRNHSPETRAEEFLEFAAVNDTTRGCLRTGSAALNLAYLAEGRFNGCWGRANKVWDISAGLLIAKEAGNVQKLLPADNKLRTVSFISGTGQAFGFLEEMVLKNIAPVGKTFPAAVAA